MAMDREKLQTYFTTHYLSRQEVLFKLPLSLSIDSFWPELVNRRKAGASVLSLYNAAGKPYWYAVTEKMISASERLCEEAMRQDDSFDPYRAPMTSAMTEEMFFTSFIEGAQIPVREAIDFLGRGTEPEDVQEQMIWNNRRAWSTMVKALYRPLDEPCVKALALMLTDEMEGRADDYRQTDEHPIAAMQEQTYIVPPAACLPERMQDFYVFLQAPDIHPLLKAAIAQAFLLVTRPFPEGNERLSRMISSAVLLRSGYDYFRDISISGFIAHENYRYYRAMCEILRPDSGNDLTYFVEYYIDLLARALQGKKDRDRQRREEAEKETAASERALARQPLGGGPIIAGAPDHSEPASSYSPPCQADTEATESPPMQRSPQMMNRIHSLLVLSGSLATDRKTRVERTLASFIEQGILAFSREQWQTATGIAKGTAQDDCGFMTRKGLVTSRKIGLFSTYTLTALTEDSEQLTVSIDAYAPMAQALRELQQTGTEREKRISELISDLLKRGITQFTHAEWCERTGLNKSVNNDDLRTACNHSLIVQTEKGYRICERVDQDKRFRTPTPMLRDAVTKLIEMFGERSFTNMNVATQLSIKQSTASYCLEQLIQKGILRQERSGRSTYQYSFTAEYLRWRNDSKPQSSASSSAIVRISTGMAAAGRTSAAMSV